jgi:uncharacterized membrane protein
MTAERLERPQSEVRSFQRPAAQPLIRSVGPLLGALALIAVLVPIHRLWSAQLLLVPLLLVTPGLILLRALKVPSRAIASFPVYVPCASLVVLIASGLAVDLLGPHVGVAAPLRTAPLLVGFEALCLALLASSANASSDVGISWQRVASWPRVAWPLILPLAAAAGALRLNSGHGSAVAFAALCACFLVLIGAMVFASRLDRVLLAVILYAVGLSLMWSFSLRGDLVYGFDISSEYYALQQTVASGIWHTVHFGDAYGAMLSVTVLPAELHSLSGISALLVFKVVYPLIGALFPVGVFGFARRVLPRRWAFAASCLVVAQSTFFQELPGLARQEVALLLFVALVAAVLDGRLTRYSQWALVALFSSAMAVSHYSTTYMAIGIFGISLLLLLVTFWLKHELRIVGAVAIAFAVTFVCAVLWYGPVTHSTSNIEQFASTTNSQGLDLLPNQAQNGRGMLGVLSAYLQYTTNSTMQATQYAKLVHKEYAQQKPYVVPLLDAGDQSYAVHDATVPAPPIRWHLGYSLLGLGALIIQQLVNLLGAVGALAMVLWRKSVVIAREVGLISVATLVILGIIRLSGTLASLYNPERAFLQGTVVLAVSLSWSVHALAGHWRERRLSRHWAKRQAVILAIAAGSLAVLFSTSTGLVAAVLGGGTASNLANSGVDYERYGMTTAELASAKWLGANIEAGQLVYADRYAQLPLVATIGYPRGLMSDVTPLTLDQHAWVYASTANVIDKQANSLFDNDVVTYAFPFLFLDMNYDTVYTDGSSEVFHR